ncbi:hypothetical protein WDW89_03770 [Deltaproteobacteria bacterium TL4]
MSLKLKTLIYILVIAGATYGAGFYTGKWGFMEGAIGLASVIVVRLLLGKIFFRKVKKVRTKPGIPHPLEEGESADVSQKKMMVETTSHEQVVLPTVYYITPMPTDIAEQILKALDHIRKNPREKINTDELLDKILDVTESSVGEIIDLTMDLIHANKLVRKLVGTLISTSLGVTRKTGKKIFKDLSHKQLMFVVEWAESILFLADMNFNDALPIKIDANYMSAFPLPKELAFEVFEIRKMVRENPKPKVHTKPVVGITMEITELLLDFYIREPIKMLGVGAFGRKLVDMGVSMSVSLLRNTVPALVDSMGTNELLIAADAFEVLIRPIEVELNKSQKEHGKLVMADFTVTHTDKEIALEKERSKNLPVPVGTVAVKTEELVDTLINITNTFVMHYLNSGLEMIRVGGLLQRLVNEAVLTSLGILKRTILKLISLRELSLEQLRSIVEWAETSLQTTGPNFALSLPYSKDQSVKLFQVIGEIKAEPVKGKHTDKIIELAVELTKTAVETRITQPMAQLKMSNFAQKLVETGVEASTRLLQTTGRIIVNNMNKEQLLIAAKRAEELFKPIAA